MDNDRFASMYQKQAPWDIPGPQPAIVELEEAGAIRGDVLDVGCGTGENALYLASCGHSVWGIDFVPAAIERAGAKAKERGIDVRFQVGDALNLSELRRTFDAVIDSGLFHTFSDEDRVKYVDALSSAIRPGGTYHVLCFSDQEPAGEGPRRVLEAELRRAFETGWNVREIRAIQFATATYPGAPIFSPGGPKALCATFVRA